MLKRLLFSLSVLSLGCGNASQSPPFPLAPTVKIGVIAPLEAGLVEFGRGIRNSVELAVQQANNSGQGRVFFQVVAVDDSSTPSVGQAAAQQLALDPQVMGVVGTYNSGVATLVKPILHEAGIGMISPGNTDPTLTLGPNPQMPVRPHDNYFRLVVPDSLQGFVLANHAFLTLGLRDAALVSEDKPVSLALVDAFEARFLDLGGNITIRQTFAEGTSNFSGIITAVQASSPEFVVFGGEFASAGPFKNQATGQGLTVPLVGSDGIKDPAYVAQAGIGSEGDLASSLGAPLESQPQGPAFLAAYQSAGFVEPPSDFGPYAFDAARLIIEAVARHGPNRSAIVQDIQGASAQGVTGPLGFDRFGDTLNRVVTIYRVEGGEFVPKATVTL